MTRVSPVPWDFFFRQVKMTGAGGVTAVTEVGRTNP
jgi:hypothetical protein